MRAFAKRTSLLRYGAVAALLGAVVLSSCGLRKTMEGAAGFDISKPFQPSKTTAVELGSCGAWQAEYLAAPLRDGPKFEPDNLQAVLSAAVSPFRKIGGAAPPALFAGRQEFSLKVQFYILYKQLKRAL